MKILVLSDSHAGISFMRHCVDVIKPNGIIHLGDFYDDGEIISQENQQIPFWQVPGNCDRYRCPFGASEVLCGSVGGVRFFMTHGHQHRVKTGIGGLLADARRSNAQLLLYGHTHQAYCAKEDDGLWVMNPGACGSWGGSVGVVEIENGNITACHIMQQADLEKIV